MTSLKRWSVLLLTCMLFAIAIPQVAFAAATTSNLVVVGYRVKNASGGSVSKIKKRNQHLD